MKYAIVEIGGTQIWVEPQKYYKVNFINVQENTNITLNRVLVINDNGEVKIGEPYVENTKLKATVISQVKGPKLIVYKMKPKKKTRKKRGHRQILSKLLINNI